MAIRASACSGRRPEPVVGQTATRRKDYVLSVLAPITNSVSTMRGGSYLPALRSKSLPRLTDQGLQKINDLAQRYGVSTDAAMTLLQALRNSNGTMAQFDHRELGGAGQWMPGGMQQPRPFGNKPRRRKKQSNHYNSTPWAPRLRLCGISISAMTARGQTATWTAVGARSASPMILL